LKDSALDLLEKRAEEYQVIAFILLSITGICGDPPSLSFDMLDRQAYLVEESGGGWRSFRQCRDDDFLIPKPLPSPPVGKLNGRPTSVLSPDPES